MIHLKNNISVPQATYVSLLSHSALINTQLEDYMQTYNQRIEKLSAFGKGPHHIVCDDLVITPCKVSIDDGSFTGRTLALFKRMYLMRCETPPRMLVANEGLEGFPTKSTENVIYLVVSITRKGFASQNAALTILLILCRIKKNIINDSSTVSVCLFYA